MALIHDSNSEERTIKVSEALQSLEYMDQEKVVGYHSDSNNQEGAMSGNAKLYIDKSKELSHFSIKIANLEQN